MSKETTKEKAKFEIEVGDPQDLRPTSLPLVVKPKDGEWQNKEQASFAATLNAYAYRNPTKFASRKALLVAQLTEIGTNPSLFYILTGSADPRVSFKDKRIEQ